MTITRPPPLTPAQVARADAVIFALSKLWPSCFQVYQGRRRPLMIGIDQALAVQLEPVIRSGRISEMDIKLALARYTGANAYLKKCVVGTARIGLDGKPTGAVTETEATSARGRIAARARRAKRSWKESVESAIGVVT